MTKTTTGQDVDNSLSDSIATGQSWLLAHAPDLGARTAELARLGKLRRKALAIERARTGRPTVAVFGQSQSGKSFLVASLAFAKGGAGVTLNVKADRPVGFLADINPVGNQKESTALVTRFSPLAPAFEDQPFRLRLLNQVDVVCLLTNACLHDLTWADYDASLAGRITDTFDRLDKLASAQAQDACTEDDIGAIEDYVRDRLLRHPGRDIFERTQFWVRAAQLVPRLPASQRWEVFQFLWDGLEALSDTCSRLLKALDAVRFSPTVHCGLDAFMPKAKQVDGRMLPHSIIDVGTLRRFFDTGRGDTVTVRIEGGGMVSIERAALAALGMEATMPLPKQAELDCPIYLQADVLDFPGYRSRNETQRSKLQDAQVRGDVLYELMLRGKVAYLFERYCDNHDINGVVFCSPPTQPNVTGLPQVLHKWVCETHGSDPKQRQTRDMSLFVVFSMFDVLYCAEPPGGTANPQAGADFHRTNVETRVVDNFVRYYSTPVADKWIDDWDGTGRAFDNCYWVRNPELQNSRAAFQDVARRDGVLREVCVSAPTVRRHFKEARRSYDAVVGPDGGVDLLVQALVGICGVEGRQRQLQDASQALARDSVQLLARYYRGGDLARELEQAVAKGRQVVGSVLALHKSANRFGVVASLLTVNHDFAWQTEFDLRAEIDSEGQPVDGQPGDLLPIGQFLLDEVEGLADLIGLPAAAPAPGHWASPESRPHHYAKTLVAGWSRRLYAGLGDGGDLVGTGLDGIPAGLLVEGLVEASERVDLVGQIARAVQPAMLRNVADRGRDEVAVLAANVFNDFVDTLGYVFVPPGERPRLKSGTTIFSVSDASRAFPERSDLVFSVAQLPGQRYFAEWLAGMLHLFEANIRHRLDAGNLDTASNQQLGGILKGHGPAFEGLVSG